MLKKLISTFCVGTVVAAGCATGGKINDDPGADGSAGTGGSAAASGTSSFGGSGGTGGGVGGSFGGSAGTGAGGTAGVAAGGSAGISAGGTGATGGSSTGGTAGTGGAPPKDSGSGDVVVGIDAGSSDSGPILCPPNTADCDNEPSNGCETGLTTLIDCGDCGKACDLPGGSEVCTNGVCTLVGCDSGFASCDDDDDNGCEINLDTDVMNCGACGDACANQHGSTKCTNGACDPTCTGLFGDCDNNPDNGCETPLNTLVDCGACGDPCDIGGTGESCATGTCVPTTCNQGFDDCDMNPGNGCETEVATDPMNCGACGTQCMNPHGTTTCTGGACAPSCDPDWEDCNGDPIDGCETSLTTTTNCGACGVPCDFTNAGGDCSTGTCNLGPCDSGFSHCDGNDGNGCERSHDLQTNACGTAEYLGTKCGDRFCGSGCGAAAWEELASRNGFQERWFRVLMDECSTCPSEVRSRITLTSPPGIDFDLYVYSSCGNEIGNSTNAGSVDQVTVTNGGDTPIFDDSYNYWIEIRYYDGSACSDWTLAVDGTTCT